MEKCKHFFKMCKRFIFDKKIRFSYFNKMGFFNGWSDEKFLKKQYNVIYGKKLNLENPIALIDKLQWLKIHDRKPEYVKMVDKYAVKDIIREVLGDQYVIPTLGVWHNPDDIPFGQLQGNYVLKPTHASGSNIICREDEQIQVKKIKRKLKKSLKTNYFYHAREWPYKDVRPAIIAEPLLVMDDGTAIIDYKFYCYGGRPIYFMYSLGEANHTVRNHKFDMNLQSIDYLFKEKPTVDISDIVLPANIDEMIKIVEKLCKGYKHIRIDLYNVNGRIYFGEFTFFSGGGYLNIKSEKFSNYLADLITIEDV